MRRILPLVLVFAGPALCAQTVTGGFCAGLTFPVGDLRLKTDQFLGFHLGGHLDFNASVHHQVRGHLTFEYIPETGASSSRGTKRDFATLQLGADWVYHLQSPRQGWYTVLGASLNSVQSEWKQSYSTAKGTATQSGKLGARGGAGYTFSPVVSIEGTLNAVATDRNGTNGIGLSTASWVQVTTVFRLGK